MHSNLDVLSLLGIIGSGIAAFIGLYHLFIKRFREDGYRFLYLVLLILSYELFYKTLIHSRMIEEYSFFYVPGRYYNFLVYPAFLAFIAKTTSPYRVFNKWSWLMLLPFLGAQLYQQAKGWILPAEKKQAMLRLFYADLRPGPYDYWSNWQTLLKTSVIPAIFLIATAYLLVRFIQKHSDQANKRLLHLFTSIIVLYFIFSQFSNLFYLAFYRITAFSMIEWPIDIIFLTGLCLLLSMVALAVNSGEQFFLPTKYQASPLKFENYEEIIRKARIQIEKEALFKTGNLTLGMLAEKINTNTKYLSQAINGHLQINFTDFINEYRIKEAKRLLKAESASVLTLEAIGKQSGFNSKSAFYKAFKKATGYTPLQFVKNTDQSRSDS